MYAGRLCLVGVSKNETLVAAYLLSSRTYSDRMICVQGTTAKVVPRERVKSAYSPDLSYECIKAISIGQKLTLVVGNGSHTDTVERTIPRSTSLEHSVSRTLESLRRKRGRQTTPRIVGIAAKDMLVLGLADENRAEYRAFQPNPGRGYYISTHQFQNIGEHVVDDFTADTAPEMINILKETSPFSELTDYIGSAAACISNGKLDLACDNHGYQA